MTRYRVLLAIVAFIAGSSEAATYSVLVGPRGELIYEPATLTIRVGDRVRFTNAGGFHNVIADDNSFRCASGCDGMGGNGSPSSSFWTAVVTFDHVATIGYYCEAHGTPGNGMVGTIIVESTPVELQQFYVD